MSNVSQDGSPVKRRNLWRRFRGLPLWVQIVSWVVAAFVVLGGIGAAIGEETPSSPRAATTLPSTASATTAAPPTNTVPPTTASPSTPSPTTSLPPETSLTPLPIKLTHADFRDGDFSQGLRLDGGVYTITLISNKPGPGIGVRVYELSRECRGVLGIVGGAGVGLPKGDTKITERQKPLKSGCYSLVLDDLLEAKVTVKFAR